MKKIAVVEKFFESHHQQQIETVAGKHGYTVDYYLDGVLRQRLYLVLREFAVHLAEHLMLFGQREIHFVFSFFCFLQQEKSETGFAFPSVLCGYLIKL